MELDESPCPQWEQWNSLYSTSRTSSDPDHRTSLLHFAIIRPQTVAPAQVFDGTFWKTVLNKFHTARPVTKPQNYFFLSLSATASYSNFFIPTMKFLCATVWEKPQKCLGAGAGDVMDSWVWGFAGKPWVSDMDLLQVSMAKAHKQEETLRESRYFTALGHYKHPERGRKPLLIVK